MIVQGNIIGFLWVGRKSAFSDKEVHSLVAVADIAANAIHRAHLNNETEQRLMQLTALRKIDTAINSNHNLHHSLGVLLEQTLYQLEVDAADILIFNQDTQELEYFIGKGFRGSNFMQASLKLIQGFTGRAALERTIIHVLDLSTSNNVLALLKETLADEGFVFYHAVPLVAKKEVKGVLQVYNRSTFEPNNDWGNFIETLAGQAAIAIDEVQLFEGLQRSNRQLELAYDYTIEGWAHALDLRDKETEGHSQRVAKLTVSLAGKLGIKGEELNHIRRGALLHDIGKMGVPDNILNKPDKLNDAEWDIMRKHPQYAYDMLSPIDYLHPALEIPYAHHEKWDGSGYPRRLQGEAIPLMARIFAVVDVWDALTSDRPYRSAWSKEKTLAHIVTSSGTHFDPQVVNAFISMVVEGEL
jgi:putative nucleotidyltransferase with HDIG domain